MNNIFKVRENIYNLSNTYNQKNPNPFTLVLNFCKFSDLEFNPW